MNAQTDRQTDKRRKNKLETVNLSNAQQFDLPSLSWSKRVNNAICTHPPPSPIRVKFGMRMKRRPPRIFTFSQLLIYWLISNSVYRIVSALLILFADRVNCGNGACMR